jgi:hypothetical protein
VPPDRSTIDAALLAHLAEDLALAALMPDGVHFDEAPPDARAFVIVSLFQEQDVATFGGRAIDDALYLVKAVAFGTSAVEAAAAAARIDALLENAVLVVAGYTGMALYREQAIAYPEVDDLDPSIRWQHRGGHYRVQCSVNGA